MASERYRANPFWRHKPLTPAQLLVQDVSQQALRPGKSARLEINEVQASMLVVDTSKLRGEKAMNDSSATPSLQVYGSTRTDSTGYQISSGNTPGWKISDTLVGQMRTAHADGCKPSCSRPFHTCNAYTHVSHISSKFPEYLQGVSVTVA